MTDQVRQPESLARLSERRANVGIDWIHLIPMSNLALPKKVGTSTTGIGVRVKRARVVDQEQYALSEVCDPIAPWKRDAVVQQGRDLPRTDVLGGGGGIFVRYWITTLIRSSIGASNRELLDAVYAGLSRLAGTQGPDSELDIRSILDQLGITCDFVFVLFPLDGGFESVARMKRNDLIEFFEDLWYPSRDDLFVIDDQLQVLLVVDHHENVGTIRLADSTAGR